MIRDWIRPEYAPRLRHLALALAGVLAIILVVASGAGEDVRPVNAGLVFLLLTLTISATFNVWAGLAAALMSNLALTYFFLPPIHRLWVSDPQHIGALAIFLLVWAFASSLLATSRALADQASRGQTKAEALLRLNRAMIGQNDPLGGLTALCREAAATFGLGGAAVLVSDPGGWRTIAASDAAAARAPSREDVASAVAALESNPSLDTASRVEKRILVVSANRGSRANFRRILVWPLPASDYPQAVFRLDGIPSRVIVRDDTTDLLGAFAGEAALALRRLELARAAERAESLRQADEVKTAILSSIAHDLKTPLATIKTSISSLRDDSVGWTPEIRSEFLDSIADESDRLNRTITSLVDLNRLESEAVRPIIQPIQLSQLVEEALELASASLSGRDLEVRVPDIAVPTDGSLMRHALANLLENAGAYSRPGGKIIVTGIISEFEAEIAVEDEGPGIDDADLHFVFDRFYKGRSGKGEPGHTGLGLAIVKGFVTLCGGQVVVESSPASTRFAITLPKTPGEH